MFNAWQKYSCHIQSSVDQTSTSISTVCTHNSIGDIYLYRNHHSCAAVHLICTCCRFDRTCPFSISLMFSLCWWKNGIFEHFVLAIQCTMLACHRTLVQSNGTRFKFWFHLVGWGKKSFRDGQRWWWWKQDEATVSRPHEGIRHMRDGTSNTLAEAQGRMEERERE